MHEMRKITRAPRREPEPKERRLLIPVWPDAGRLLGLSRSAAYRAWHRGDIPGVAVNGRLHVPVRKLEAMLGLDPGSLS
jgi:hypothetical protein